MSNPRTLAPDGTVREWRYSDTPRAILTGCRRWC